MRYAQATPTATVRERASTGVQRKKEEKPNHLRFDLLRHPVAVLLQVGFLI